LGFVLETYLVHRRTDSAQCDKVVNLG
jgi:hypothetical protein